MGLDQYAYHCNKCDLNNSQVDFSEDNMLERVKFHYWRKHPNLQGWMEQLYRKKGGMSEDFNCAPVRLMPQDLDDLELAIKSGELPITSGFFYGKSMGDELDDDMQFIAEARHHLARGKAVYYTSWW